MRKERAMANRKSSLPNSKRTPLPGAHPVGPVDPDERLEVTIRVRSRAKTALPELIARRAESGKGGPMTREQFEKTHGADPADLKKVVQFAKQHKLTVVEESAPRRSVVLSATARAFGAAFGVRLARYELPGGTYRGRTGTVSVPANLRDIVEGVFGLDDRPQAAPHLRVAADQGEGVAQPHASGGSFIPSQVAKLYGFPAAATGAGQCIGLIELGGGFRPADLTTYFQAIGVSPAPQVIAVSVDHGSNTPTGSANGPDGEVMLDIEVAGAIAHGARIVVYFAPNTDRGFLDAITTAVHDKKNKPSVISISWGSAEANWTAQAMQSFDQAFQAAAAMGVTVCCASGDNGSSDGEQDGKNHVDFPASSPFALGCGGTRLVGSGTAITSEVVWNDGASGGATGGGVSAVFARPTWQSTAHVPSSGQKSGGRGVPDVSGDADPVSGYRVRVDGHDAVIGGTSAVAPLWAALIALINQHKGKPVGYINPHLYTSPGMLRDITTGNNGAYKAGTGWDPCTGLGSPNGAKLAAAL
jgi:kumamolisin